VMALLLWAGVATALAFSGPVAAGVTRAGGSHLAILPFDNQGSADDAYFADGIADEVRGKLARVNGITVIASSSANQYKGSSKAPQEIAKELGADYLLIGKVRWAGTAGGARKVQVVPELVDGRTGATTWQQSFDTDVTDVFSVQAEIATRVATALGARLGSGEAEQLAARPTTDPAAYDLYLKGKAVTSSDVGSMRQAAAFFEQAVALDSTFVEAWAALSTSLARVFFNGSRDPASASRSSEAMRRAIELDSSSAVGWVAAARYYGTVAPEPTKAFAAIERALQLAPNDAEVVTLAADVDMRAGSVAAATAKLERARDLDPRSPAVLSALQTAYIYQHRFAEAVAVGEAATALSPNDLLLIEWQAIAHLAQGSLKGAREAVKAGIARGNPAPQIAAIFGGYYETAWALEDADRGLLFRLTPAAFDGDRAWWGQSLATGHLQEGDLALARAYADSSLPATRAQLAEAPTDGQLHALLGLMLVYRGDKAEGIAEAERGERLGRTTGNTGEVNQSYLMLLLVRTYLAAGEPEKALDVLEQLVDRAYFITPAWLRLDPTFRTLKGNPRFERLLARGS